MQATWHHAQCTQSHVSCSAVTPTQNNLPYMELHNCQVSKHLIECVHTHLGQCLHSCMSLWKLGGCCKCYPARMRKGCSGCVHCSTCVLCNVYLSELCGDVMSLVFLVCAYNWNSACIYIVLYLGIKISLCFSHTK